MSAREEAQLAQLEVNRARIEAEVARVQFSASAFKPMLINSVVVRQRNLRVVCPRIRVSVPRVSIPHAPIDASFGACRDGGHGTGLVFDRVDVVSWKSGHGETAVAAFYLFYLAIFLWGGRASPWAGQPRRLSLHESFF